MVDFYSFSILIFLFGLVFGSFANVIIHRLPQGESVIFPASRCPHCSKKILFYHNVPILSWIFLRGKCSSCGTKISWRYPFVEILMASLFVLIYLKHGVSWSFLEHMILIFALVVLTFIDFDHMILPNEITLSGVVVGFVFSFFNPEREVLDAFLGIFLGGGFLWGTAFFYERLTKKEGLGGGDIKLLAMLGAFLGWQSVFFIILTSSVIGLLCGVPYLIYRRSRISETPIPFGPYICISACIYIFFGKFISTWYVDTFLLS